MISVTATTVLERNVITVTCHHGWRDKKGHDLFRGSAEVLEQGPVDLVVSLAEVITALARSAVRGDLDLSDDCGLL